MCDAITSQNDPMARALIVLALLVLAFTPQAYFAQFAERTFGNGIPPSFPMDMNNVRNGLFVQQNGRAVNSGSFDNGFAVGTQPNSSFVTLHVFFIRF